ncbi:MAG: carboxy terminal-processing peptidase [Gammaproteobacteria bacterium]|nr:carboxy terminal-processing peptidase [Gammaproteobacteria bacterium]
MDISKMSLTTLQKPTQYLIALIVAIITILASASQSQGNSSISLSPLNEHSRSTKLITRFLSKYHYKTFKINNSLSDQIFDSYIEALDPNRSYFYQKDIDSFQIFRYKLDDALNHPELNAPFQMFRLYQARVDERALYALGLLKEKFNFSINEKLIIDRSKLDWAVDKDELDEIWRKRVKNDVLALRLAEKDAGEIKDTLVKRYKGIAKRSQQIDAEDVYQLFINAFASTLEPHTNYLSPRTSENFEIRMSLSLEGIGALLRTDGEYTLVEKIIPGGPADLCGLLHATDRIVGIAQQNEKEFNDVIGWRLEEVVEQIRGTKDTKVKLQILPGKEGQTAKIKEIHITRDKIKLEEQAARSEVIEIHDESKVFKIGVIDIPAFYIDFAAYQRGESDYRSTTRDVDNLIKQLKSEKIDALILDLRSNGGGSLTEATQVTGLFIDEGPIVQVRDSNGHIEVHRDLNTNISYQGPLIVLVDRFSASASEILASAIQDYHRGMVVGETTFGKGTVQQLVDLNNFDSTRDEKLGQLKATIAQYFRINGGSTQHRGVVPDIDFHTNFTSDEYGERALKNALPWTSISPISHHYGFIDEQIIKNTASMHDSRIKVDDKFNSLVNILQLDSELRNKKTISLLESTRKKEYEKIESIRAANQKFLKNTEANLNKLDDDEQYIDVLLDETAHIATDLAKFLKSHRSNSFVDQNH